MTKTKLVLAPVFAVIASASITGDALAASRTHHVQSQELINRRVTLPYNAYGTNETFNRYSGPFRTDASPNSGGS